MKNYFDLGKRLYIDHNSKENLDISLFKKIQDKLIKLLDYNNFYFLRRQRIFIVYYFVTSDKHCGRRKYY